MPPFVNLIEQRRKASRVSAATRVTPVEEGT